MIPFVYLFRIIYEVIELLVSTYVGIKSLELMHNLPPLVLKDRHLSGSAFCWIDIGLPEQAVGQFPLGLG